MRWYSWLTTSAPSKERWDRVISLLFPPCSRLSCLATALLLAALAVPGAAAAQEGELYSTPEAVARLFFAAFERKDFTTLRSLFLPEAVVSRVRVTAAGGTEAVQLSAGDWAAAAEADLTPVEELAIDLLEVRSLTFAEGASVSVLFQATGHAGGRAFVNDGVDTFGLIPVKGSWRIAQYASFEALKLTAAEPEPPPGQ